MTDPVVDSDVLTVPVHGPDANVHGFDESAVTVVTPTASVMTMPTESEPTLTVIVSAVAEIVPVPTADENAAGLNAPAGLEPEHALVSRPVAAPYVPAGQGIGVTEPATQ